MATNIIDTMLHGSAFPSTYTGPGTLIGNPISEQDTQGVSGYFTSNGNATEILLGFVPTEVEIVDVTDALTWKWQYGMPSTDAIKITLGTVAGALDTTSQIVVGGSVVDGSGGNGTVTLGATLCGTAKNIVYKIK